MAKIVVGFSNSSEIIDPYGMKAMIEIKQLPFSVAPNEFISTYQVASWKNAQKLNTINIGKRNEKIEITIHRDVASNSINFVIDGKIFSIVDNSPNEDLYLQVSATHSSNNPIREGQVLNLVTDFPCKTLPNQKYFLGGEDVYYQMKRKYDGAFATTKQGKLKIEVEEKYIDRNFTFYVLNSSGKVLFQKQVPATYGTNFVTLDFINDGLQQLEFYHIEVEGAKGDKRVLRFRYNEF